MPNLQRLLILTSFAGASGFALGCVIVGNVDDDDDPCPGLHNEYDEDSEECFCDDGYDWCDPDDEDDLRCCTDDGNDDDSSTSSTSGGTGDTSGTGGGTDDGPTECPAPEPPSNSSCTEDGLVYCTNTDAMGPECSGYYECQSGTWVLNTTAGNETCDADGYDFSFGCVDDGSAVVFLCGNGPGTDCDASTEASFCMGDDVIHECLFGKLTEDSCMNLCQNIGDENGITYDTGTCSEEDGNTAVCACCDLDEPGCGDGGTTSDTGGEGGSDTTGDSGSTG